MKRILSTIMSAALLATSAYMPVSAFEEGTVAFPFTMFAASDAEGALTLNTSYACVNGKIATNGTVASSGSMTVNGAIKENAGEEMVYIPTKINENYFSGSGLTVEEGDYVLEQTHINLNSALAATGSLTVNGNLNLYAGLKALNDVTLTGSAVNAGNALLYSETGDININVSNFNFSGLIYAPFGNVTIDSDYISLNSVVVLAQTITINSIGLNANYGRGVGYLVGTESEATDTYRLVAGGNYLEEENSIEVSWDTDCEEPQSFRVLTSETGTAYTAAATVTEGRSYLYPVDDDFDTMYFKVEMTTEEGRKVESAPFIMTKTEAGFEITYPDTDGDGLPDNYEIMVGTDIRKPDTDGDGLTDYQEVILTLTDPLVVDSFTEGVSDADADCDEDGLTNAEEIALGTDPRMADTDKDGLSDSDEVNVHNTDPLNADTDGDGVKDGDELAYELDPNKQDTDEDGVSDGDENVAYTVTDKQIASTLKKDNTAVPTELTVNTKIGDGSKIKVKKYSGHLLDDDRFIIGKVLNVTGAEFEGGHIAFTLSESYTVPTYTIAGTETNGLLICYYDGTDSTPLATSYDAETRVLSADMESEGCYFIMDLMDWMNSMGIDPETFYTEPLTESDDEEEEIPEETPAAPAPKMAARALRAPGSTTIANIPIRGQVDIVFVVDTTGSMTSYINNVRDNLIAFVNDIESAGIKPYFALVEYRDITHDGVNSTKVKHSASGSCWFSNANEYKAEIAKLTVNGGGDIDETAIDGLEAARRLNLRTSAQKFFILVTDAGYKVANNYGISSMNEMISLLNAKNINTSVVSASSNRSTYSSLFTQTHGIFANVSGNFKSELLRIAGMIDEETNNGTWIALSGFIPQIVKLNAKPTAGSDTDTDGDGISDVDELGGATPDKYLKVSELLYALGLPRTITDGQIAYYSYNSNPTKKDTDNDGFEDNEDNRPRQKGYYDASVDDVVIGELAIISCNDGSFYGGHAFFGYQSYVNDQLDFSDIYGGYGSTNHYPMVADVYPIKRDEYITIGGAANDTGVDQDDFLSTSVSTIGFKADSIAFGENPGAATGGSSAASGALNSSGVASGSGLGSSSGSGSAASSGSGSSGISGSGSASGLSGFGLAALLTRMDGGVLFNRELQGIYTGYSDYESNYALIHKLTQDQWDDMMDYMEDNNYYIFLRHNCTTIATEAWNRIFDDNLNAAFSGIVTTETPKRLKESLKNRSGSITNYLARIRSDA